MISIGSIKYGKILVYFDLFNLLKFDFAKIKPSIICTNYYTIYNIIYRQRAMKTEYELINLVRPTFRKLVSRKCLTFEHL